MNRPFASLQPNLSSGDRIRNLKAKTGTIEGVSALTGVVKTRDQEELLFSIISNGLRSTNSSKRIENLIGSHLADFQRTPGTHWQ